MDPHAECDTSAREARMLNGEDRIAGYAFWRRIEWRQQRVASSWQVLHQDATGFRGTDPW
jgi:hypothetical protein